MASYVGGASADSNTVSLPAGTAAGDIAVVLAFSTNLSSQPTVPSGWTALSTQTVDNTTDQAQVVAYKVLDSSDVSGGIGTWTNSSSIAVLVYRGLVISITNSGASPAYSSTLTFPALTFLQARTWVIAFGSHNNPGTNPLKDRTLTSYINRSGSWTSNKIGAWDTNGFVSSTSSRTTSVTNTDANVGRTVALTVDEEDWVGTDALTANNIVSSTFVAQPALIQKHTLSATGASSASTVAQPTISQKHSLIATAILSATTVANPALTQVHALTANGVSSATTVGQPSLVANVALTANGVSSATSVQSAAINQLHGLSAVGLSSASSVSQPTLAQVHNVSASGVSSASTVGSPTLVANSGLSASSISSASTVANPTLTQLHNLSANGVSSASTVGVPSSGSNVSLTANPVASASTVANPAISQKHSLSASGVSSTSTVANPAISQVHSLTASGVNSATTVGQPTLVANSGLAATGISSATTVAQPSISQKHSLTATGVSSASYVGAPSSGANVSLTANGVSSATSVAAPAVNQSHSLTASGVSSNSSVGQPAINTNSIFTTNGVSSATFTATPSISQKHSLTANGVSSASTVGMPSSGSNNAFDAVSIYSSTFAGSPTTTQNHSLSAMSIVAASRVDSFTLTSTASGNGLMVAQCNPEDECCGNGEYSPTCSCQAWGNKCSIGWSCYYPIITGTTIETLLPERFRIIRVEDPIVVLLESTELSGSYQVPAGTNAEFAVQYCCQLTDGECVWVDLWRGTIDNREDECSLFCGGWIKVMDPFSGISPSCGSDFRVFGQARKASFDAPGVVKLEIDGVTVYNGPPVTSVGCLPGDNDWVVAQGNHACGDMSYCDPPTFLDSGGGILYVDIPYPVPFYKSTVQIKATNADGTVAACNIPLPCQWHYNAIRLGLPAWSGQDLDCSHSYGAPLGHSPPVSYSVWKQNTATAATLTGSWDGGTYAYYVCNGSIYVVTNGAFSYHAAFDGEIKWKDGGGTIHTDSWSEEYWVDCLVEYWLEVEAGPGYLFGNAPSPISGGIYVFIKRNDPTDSTVGGDVTVRRLRSWPEGPFDEGYPVPQSIDETVVYPDCFFGGEAFAGGGGSVDGSPLLMGFTGAFRVRCDSYPRDDETEIHWTWRTPWNYVIAYQSDPGDWSTAVGICPVPAPGSGTGVVSDTRDDCLPFDPDTGYTDHTFDDFGAIIQI